MTRVDDDMLALHLEVALSTTAPSLLNGLADGDGRRRHVLIGQIARELAQRLRCFDIVEQPETRIFRHPSLFPQDLGPIG